MASYEIVSVRRTPQSATIPTYTELGPLRASTFTVMDHKTLTPSELTLTVSLGSVDDDSKTALRDLAAQPLEVWVYRGGTRIFAGPIVGGDIAGDSLNLSCRGRLIYLGYMLVWADKSFTSADLFTMGKTLIDDWQALTYGNFGLLTASIGTLGVTRSLEIPGASEFPTVAQSLGNIALGSFDVWLNPDTGNVEFAASRGSDLSASVSIERGVANAAAGFALGPGLVASELYAAGTAPDSTLFTSKSDATLRAAFGRTGLGVTHDPVTDASHLSDLADQDLAEVGTMYFNPGGELFEVEEADFEDLEPGNTVEYSKDYGLGKVTKNVRVQKRELTVTPEGQERLYVEFE